MASMSGVMRVSQGVTGSKISNNATQRAIIQDAAGISFLSPEYVFLRNPELIWTREKVVMNSSDF